MSINPSRISQLKFHVKSDEYFATLAQILEFLRSDLEPKDTDSAAQLERLKEDLVYLQRHYRIVRKMEEQTA